MQVKDAFHGRVMAIYVMTFLGIARLGSLAAGTLAEMMGVRFVLSVLRLPVVVAGEAYHRASAAINSDRT